MNIVKLVCAPAPDRRRRARPGLRLWAWAVGGALWLSAGVLAAGAGNAPAGSGARRILHGHVPAAVTNLPPLGRLPGTTNLSLAIGLPLRDPAGLSSFLQQLHDPTSPQYQQYLTPEQFTALFGPTAADYQAVVQFAEINGLRVIRTHPNRLVLDVQGAVADIERSFHVTLRRFQHPRENRAFYAPDAEPSLDRPVPILHVSGLDDYLIPRPRLHKRPVARAARATPRAGSGPGGTFWGNDFRAAYVPGTTLTGAGQSVGLLEYDGYNPGDITAYIAKAGIATSVVLTNVAVDGGVGTPGDGSSEVCLDIEMALAMAPGLSQIIVYEAPNPTPWVDLLSRMANDNLARQLSCSWGGGLPDPAAEQIFQQMAAQGQTFFNASGDSGAFTGAIDFPSESTNIVQVGGTALTTAAAGAYVSETVWNDGADSSGGGISVTYPLPSYQQGLAMTANHGSTTLRNIPDVALTAENVYVFDNNGSAETLSGTSCSTVLWAGFTALVNQQAAAYGRPPVGFLNPALYALGRGPGYASRFHDITTGNNFTRSSPNDFPAVAGYDLCTGWGTPNGTNLINALAPAPTNAPPTLAATPASQTKPVGGTAVFSVTVMGTAPFYYQWLKNGVGIGGANAAVYSMANVQTNAAGLYSVLVSNAFGAVTSAAAVLSVTPRRTVLSWLLLLFGD